MKHLVLAPFMVLCFTSAVLGQLVLIALPSEVKFLNAPKVNLYGYNNNVTFAGPGSMYYSAPVSGQPALLKLSASLEGPSIPTTDITAWELVTRNQQTKNVKFLNSSIKFQKTNPRFVGFSSN
jgi:hypothetical protein